MGLFPTATSAPAAMAGSLVAAALMLNRGVGSIDLVAAAAAGVAVAALVAMAPRAEGRDGPPPRCPRS